MQRYAVTKKDSESIRGFNRSLSKDAAHGHEMGNILLTLPEENRNLDILDCMSDEDKKIWTDADKTMFRIFHGIFPRNYCCIAFAMMTKTCQQVLFFLRLAI